MPKREILITEAGLTTSQSILEAVADTLGKSRNSLPSPAVEAARSSDAGERIRNIESTKDLSEKDFALMINARG